MKIAENQPKKSIKLQKSCIEEKNVQTKCGDVLRTLATRLQLPRLKK